MASRVEYHSSVTLGGMAAMCAAIGLCALVLGQLTRSGPTPLGLTLVLLGGGAGLLVILSRVGLPQSLKVGCILVTLGMLFLTVSTGDVFRMNPTAKKAGTVSADSTNSPADAAARDPSRPERRLSAGATVRLVGSSRGDRGWASRLDAALSGRIGGPSSAWLRIEGEVSAQEGDGQHLVVVNWGIAGSDSGAKCGTTAIAGRDANAILEQFRETFEASATRSNNEKRASCL